MAIMIDADVFIRVERSTSDLKGWFAAHSDDHFEIAAITVAELWHGLERATSKHRAQHELYLQPILQGLPIITYSRTTALEHARI